MLLSCDKTSFVALVFYYQLKLPLFEREIIYIKTHIFRLENKYLLIEKMIMGNAGMRFFNGTLGRLLLSGICSYFVNTCALYSKDAC